MFGCIKTHKERILDLSEEEKQRAESRAAPRQTKSVWHAARNGPIARILLGGEKGPWPFGGLFRRLEKRERRGMEAGVTKSKSRRCARWRKRGSPLTRAVF